MSEQTDHDEPDDVEGHRFLTPDQAQQRAQEMRRKQRESHDEAADPVDGDS